MKYFFITLFALTPIFCFCKEHISYSSQYGFIKNNGQIIDQYRALNSSVLFLWSGSGLNMHLNKNSFSYELVQHQPSGLEYAHRVDVELIGAEANPVIVTERQAADDIHYFTEQVPFSGVVTQHFYKVVYKDIYPGIDLEFLLDNGHVATAGPKYNFVIRPGGDPAKIQLRYHGAVKTSIDEGGSISVITTTGSINERIPESYEYQSKKRVQVRYNMKDGNTFSFITEAYDHSDILVIDPWATYYGGSADDALRDVAADAAGNVYAVGSTNSQTNIATAGAHQASYVNGVNAMLVKFNAAGARKWSTYYGAMLETGNSVAVDNAGNVLLAGTTTAFSPVFYIATAGAHQVTNGGSEDAFLVKFDSTGTRLWGTFYGGLENDKGNSVCTDALGNIYLTGTTSSTSGIATSGAFAPTLNAWSMDAFLVKFNAAGVRQWGTYYGGTDNELGTDVASDAWGNVFIGGTTNSYTGIATPGAHQINYSVVMDAFVVKFDSTGSRRWGTYYGGQGNEECMAIATDAAGSVILAGLTRSTANIATAGAHQPVYSANTNMPDDAFIAKLDSAGVRLWGTYYGHTQNDIAYGIVTDAASNIYMAGETRSGSNIATPGTHRSVYSFQAHVGDVMLVKFNSNGVRQWGTYYGGAGIETVRGIAINGTGHIAFTGTTSSNSGIATPGAYQTAYQGMEGFIAVLDTAGFFVPFSPIGNNVITGNQVICSHEPPTTLIGSTPTGGNGAVQYQWLWGTSANGPFTQAFSDTKDHTPYNPGNGTWFRRVVFGGDVTDTSNAISISVIQFDTAIISKMIPLQFCDGDSAYFMVLPSNGYSYQWRLGGLDIPGATNIEYTAHQSGIYQLYSSANGCDMVSFVAQINPLPLPSPVIVQNGPALEVTGAYQSYQWYVDGIAIPGATSYAQLPLVNGLYTVRVSASGCFNTSPGFLVSYLGVSGFAQSTEIILSPNPVKDVMMMTAGNEMLDGEVRVSDITGKIVITRLVIGKEVSLNTSSLLPGIYLFVYTSREGTVKRSKFSKL